MVTITNDLPCCHVNNSFQLHAMPCIAMTTALSLENAYCNNRLLRHWFWGDVHNGMECSYLTSSCGGMFIEVDMENCCMYIRFMWGKFKT